MAGKIANLTTSAQRDSPFAAGMGSLFATGYPAMAAVAGMLFELDTGLSITRFDPAVVMRGAKAVALPDVIAP